MSGVSLRLMKEDDIKHVIEWTSDEEWAITEFDLEVYRSCHPQDFFIAEIEGKPVGSISAIRNDDNTGMLGAFIMKKDLRGKGIGRVLLKKALEHLEIKKGVRLSGLSGREAVVPSYVKYGFTNCVWNVIIYGGKVDVPKVMNFSSIDGVEVSRITNDNLDLLLSYDKNIQTISNRRQYFEEYLKGDSNVICVAVKGHEGDSQVLGMAMATPAAAGWGSAIHPFYADSQDIAKVIFRYLLENQPNVTQGVYFDTIEPNAQNVAGFMSAIGINGAQHSLKRQYTGKEISTCYDKIYGLSNTDLHLF